MPASTPFPGYDGRFTYRPYEPRDKKVVGILRAIAHHEEPNETWEKPPSDKITHHTVVVEDANENSRVVAAARIIVTEPRLAHLQFVCVEKERRGQVGLDSLPGVSLVYTWPTAGCRQFDAVLTAKLTW